MKVQLLYKDHDANREQPLPWNAADLVSDLELDILFRAMAGEDEYFGEVCRSVLLTSITNDVTTIVHRQEVLKDSRKNEGILVQLYDITLGAMEVKKKYGFGIFSTRPSSILYDAIVIMEQYVKLLRELRNLATLHKKAFSSEGFCSFFTLLETELSEDYLATVLEQAADLRLRDGILVSATIGRAGKGAGYVLHRLHLPPVPWYRKLFMRKPDIYTFDVHPRDESGARALDALRNMAVNEVANALAQSCDHILHFFSTLRYELAFYMGCLHLEKKLVQLGMPVSFPAVVPAAEKCCSFNHLYDACLALSMDRKVEGNDLQADRKNPVIITGANQGGKSTFLRSTGIAQLMAQAGMYIPAAYGKLSLCDGLITHFKRGEDTEMKSGKFDEELSRMNIIAEKITPCTLMLFNESFASTNEREGSEIAEQIVRALTENGTRVFFVTHLYVFARSLYGKLPGKALFLRAERDADQKRTFKLKEGESLKTSYGIDLYEKIFNDEVVRPGR